METASSLRSTARTAGGLYLVVIATAMFAEGYVRSGMIVAGDAATTAHNIAAAPMLWRLGGVADLINLTCDVGVAVLLYRLLRPAGRWLALAAALFRVTADALLAGATMLHFAAGDLVLGAPPLATFAPLARDAVALSLLHFHGLAYTVSILFFASNCLLLGWLIVRSALLPRPVGALMLLAGLCYAVNSLAHLAAPEAASNLSVYLLLPGFVAELALMLWLLLRGVDAARWQKVSATRP